MRQKFGTFYFRIMFKLNIYLALNGVLKVAVTCSSYLRKRADHVTSQHWHLRTWTQPESVSRYSTCLLGHIITMLGTSDFWFSQRININRNWQQLGTNLRRIRPFPRWVVEFGEECWLRDQSQGKIKTFYFLSRQVEINQNAKEEFYSRE